MSDVIKLISLNFVSDVIAFCSVKSQYRRGEYRPATSVELGRTFSRLSSTGRSMNLFKSLPSTARHVHPTKNKQNSVVVKSDLNNDKTETRNTLRVEFQERVEEITQPENADVSDPLTSAGAQRTLSRRMTSDTDRSESAPAVSTATYIDTSRSLRLPVVERLESSEEKNARMVNVPPFVQLESLHAGRVFVAYKHM